MTMRPLLAPALLAAMLSLPALGAPRDTGKCLMWEVRDGKNALFILGSLHYADESMYPVDPAIEAAYRRAAVLVFEVAMTPTIQNQGVLEMDRRGAYPAGQDLRGDLSENGFRELEAFLKEKDVPLFEALNVRPWMLSARLMAAELVRRGFVPDLGTEAYFTVRAATDKKEVVGVETLEEQLDTLASGTKAEQERLLLETLRELSRTDSEMTDFIEAWKGGDGDFLNERLLAWTQSPEDMALRKRFFDDRNVRMVERLETYLKSGKPCLAIIGAGHLVGDKGVARLFEKRGYATRQTPKQATQEKKPDAP